MQYLILALKIKVNRAVGDACLACNIRNFGIEVTIASKNLDRGTQYGLALVGNAFGSEAFLDGFGHIIVMNESSFSMPLSYNKSEF
jgi:hypothetical protein